MSQPVRIAFVITELEVGGAERCLTNLVLGLDRTKFDPIVISLKPEPIPSQRSLVKQLQNAGVPVEFIGLRSPLSGLRALRQLKRRFCEHKTEVVQTFLFHANVLGSIAARRAGIKRIIGGIRVADPSRWRMRLERFALRNAQDVVCVSQSVADFMHTSVGIPSAKLRVIPNGIDLEQIEKTPASDSNVGEIPTKRRVLLGVGRLHEQKGFDWLIQVAPTLLDRLPDHDIVIVGEGPQRQPLEKLANEKGVAECVHFVGWRSDVIDIMRSSEQFVLTSRWEGMPNALIEAMAIGLPVVATDVEGVSEVLGPLADQQLVPFGQDNAFVEAITRNAHDEASRRKLGQANQQRISDEFSLRKMIEAYEALYFGEIVSPLPRENH